MTSEISKAILSNSLPQANSSQLGHYNWNGRKMIQFLRDKLQTAAESIYSEFHAYLQPTTLNQPTNRIDAIFNVLTAKMPNELVTTILQYDPDLANDILTIIHQE